LHEIDPSLPCPRLEASLFDDWVSSFPLKSYVVDDAALTSLWEAFDPLDLLVICYSIFHSKPMDNSVSYSILVASPLSLAQCTGLEMGETSRGDASSMNDVSLS